MSIQASDQGGYLDQLAHWIERRNAASSGPRANTASPIPAMASIQGLQTIPGLTAAGSPAGGVRTPGQGGLGAPMVTPSVGVPFGLGLRVDALA